ncbi:MAG: NHLP family bacteriocin export ABC transporter peptidase/permease/ATPase subunit [Selenomonadaceae bacterium]|nr:NHLP family bacteriocin export ABC transporter peptidase/permease/ATPase subunit [Selenomonadaceae bacterium]
MLKFFNKFFSSDGYKVSVPTVMQIESTECGAASLAMILAYYNMWIPLEKLRIECGVNRDGSKASNIIKAARRRNCAAKGFRIIADSLKNKKFPLIIHWEFNHFLVLEGIKDGFAYLNDPAMGKRKVIWEDFKTSYTGIALEIKPGENFKPEGQQYNIFDSVFKKLMNDKSALVFVFLIGFAMIVPGLVSPVFNQIFIDDILSGKHPDWMFNFCLAMVLTILLLSGMTALRAYILTRWQRKLTLADSSRFFWHILRLPIPFFQQRFAAEIASRVSFNESVANVLSNSVATSLLDLFTAVFYLLLLFQYSFELTMIGLTFSAIEMFVLYKLRRRLTDLNMRIQQDAGKEYGTLVNGITMIESVKANGTEGDLFSKWSGYHSKVLIASQKVQLWSLASKVLPVFLSSINTAMILTIGGFSIMEGVMSSGIFISFQSLYNNFHAPIDRLAGLATTLQSTEMQMRRLDDVLAYPIDSLNYPDKIKNNELKRLTGKIELCNINFGYSPLEPPLLENFNLTVEPGRWVAIVGGSGSGKSTLSKIVTGLYEEWSGEVKFDGMNRREIPRNVITGSFAAVDQDIFQISGSIRDNIALFDGTIDKRDVMAAAIDACIHDEIMKLEGGYEYVMSEGGLNFSGGQRQRLEIARALAVNPSILVLDEATSALDPITEQTVLKNIRRRGCSCFIVAHRLSTIRDCDEIIVLESGKAVERGTHTELMANNGAYRRLIESKEG